MTIPRLNILSLYLNRMPYPYAITLSLYPMPSGDSVIFPFFGFHLPSEYSMKWEFWYKRFLRIMILSRHTHDYVGVVKIHGLGFESFSNSDLSRHLLVITRDRWNCISYHGEDHVIMHSKIVGTRNSCIRKKWWALDDHALKKVLRTRWLCTRNFWWGLNNHAFVFDRD